MESGAEPTASPENDDDPAVYTRLASEYTEFAFDWFGERDKIAPAEQDARDKLRQRQRNAYYRVYKTRATD